MTRRILERLDRLLERIYGTRWNPVQHSGSIAVALLVVLLVTGIYLLLFYRIGSPYASVERITNQPWTGRWIRSLHRYASDAMVVAVAVHALRMYARRRTWGPRLIAWVSGVMLVGLFMLVGWTGYVMVWDTQAYLLAVEGARFLDALPIFSEPIGRSFVGESPVPSAFFFLNLFLHIALPVGLLLLLWLHVTRVARPTLLPPRAVLWTVVGALTAVSVLLPTPMAPEADLFRLPERAPVDLFFSFFLPLTGPLAAHWVWLIGGLLVTAVLLVPLFTRPRQEQRPGPSIVNERVCTGCEQCYHDCPYDAIAMVEREDGRDTLVARVDESYCVSCGICSASCAPMALGPAGRTGRDQLGQVKQYIAARGGVAGEVVIAGCTRSACRDGDAFDGAPLFRVVCAGTLHTSTVEQLVRAGAAGVLVVACPPDDCWNREGPKWAGARLFEGREAELKERVDRRRVRLVHASALDAPGLRAALDRFRAELAAIEPPAPAGAYAPPPLDELLGDDADLIALCDADDDRDALQEAS
jgi:ferredoxin